MQRALIVFFILVLGVAGGAALRAATAGAGEAAAAQSGSPEPLADPDPTPVTTAHGAGDAWQAKAVTVSFSVVSPIAAPTTTYVQVDGGAVTDASAVVIHAPRDHDNDGSHVVSYWSADDQGNVEAPRSLTVRIDTTPPRVDHLRLSPSLLHRSRPLTLSFTVRDIAGSVRDSYVVRDQYGYRVRRVSGLERSTGPGTVTITPRYGNGRAFMPGLYRVTLQLRDPAGNVTATRPYVFRDYRPAKARVWYHVRGAGKRVALTFDDGGPPWVWDRMLDVLKAYHMHATFFILGPYVSASPRLARRTVREGNGIGSHGWTHTEMTRQGYDGVRHELIRSESPWWYAARATPVGYCRPPYGSHNRTTVAAAGSAGFTRFIMWDVDPGDWRGYGSGTIAANTLSHVHSGAIIGLHVRPATAAALPAILSGLRARGYRSVSLPEMFHTAGMH